MRSHLFRGVTFGTMLRDEAYHFIRLGTLIERADNTARILDVKYHMLLPATEESAARSTITSGARCCARSGFRAYRKVYHDMVYPRRVAELLILRDDMPRSLHHCYESAWHARRAAGDKALECRSMAGQTYARLKYGRIDRIFRSGLHEFLTGFIEQNNALGAELQEDFLMVRPPWRGRRDHDDQGRAHHRLQLFRAADGKHAIFAKNSGSGRTQAVEAWKLTCPGATPTPGTTSTAMLPYLNDGAGDQLEIKVSGLVRTRDSNGVIGVGQTELPSAFIFVKRLIPLRPVDQGLAARFRPKLDRDAPSTAHEIMLGIAEDVPYSKGETHVHTTGAEALEQGSGVCQDHAHIFCAICRSLGIPARYASGYLAQGGGHDAHAASHAWAEAYVEDLGWVSFDPSNAQRDQIVYSYRGWARLRGGEPGARRAEWRWS